MNCITLMDLCTEFFFRVKIGNFMLFLCYLPYFRIILCSEQNFMIFYDFMPRGTPATTLHTAVSKYNKHMEKWTSQTLKIRFIPLRSNNVEKICIYPNQNSSSVWMWKPLRDTINRSKVMIKNIQALLFFYMPCIYTKNLTVHLW